MDIPALATQLATYVAPLVPLLAAGAGSAVDEMGGELGKSLGQKGAALAADIWRRISALLGADSPAVQEALAEPGSEDACTTLAVSLKHALAKDPALARELAELLRQAQGEGAGVGVVAKGERSVAIGGAVSRSIIVTGDGNAVRRG